MSSKSNVDYNAQTALDIEFARRNAKLNVAATRAFLHGGEYAWRARERVVAILSADPVFDRSQRYYATRKEIFKQMLAIQNRFEELRMIHNWDERDMFFVRMALDEPMSMFAHNVAFGPVIMSQGSEELKAEFGPLIKFCGIMGSYLQTELGHGSNVAQLETTATYVPESDEFEIHSPTLTSTKWWSGGLGKLSNYGAVQARLILPGNKDMGPHLFLVQLRSLDTHEVLPRIIAGDIGPKAMAGFPGIDNGYARFDHLRIPRSQMLSKFAQVTKEGKYITPPHSKMSYGGMLSTRSEMLANAGFSLSKAAIISLRYTTVRRQGNKGHDGLERQVITYPSVYYRLLPILARAYVYTLLARNIESTYNILAEQLKRGEVSFLPDMHAITSGIKVLVTTTSAQDIETARRAMGGHGYSAYAALGKVYADYVPNVTFEGDNYVLDGQVVRAALKAYNQPSSTQRSTFHAYLRLLNGEEDDSQTTVFESPDWTDWQVLIKVSEWRAARAVKARAIAQKAGTVDASSDYRVSRAVSEAYVATQVGGMITSLDSEELGESVIILKTLFHLYLISTAEQALVDYLDLGVILPQGSDGKRDPALMLRLELDHACTQLLPEAISLSDAFGYTNWELDSALGVYDGRVYEELWRKVQGEPLNQSEVTEGYKEYIKPLLERGRALAMGTKPKL